MTINVYLYNNKYMMINEKEQNPIALKTNKTTVNTSKDFADKSNTMYTIRKKRYQQLHLCRIRTTKAKSLPSCSYQQIHRS